MSGKPFEPSRSRRVIAEELSKINQTAEQYLLALGLAVAALTLRGLLSPFLGVHLQFTILIAAVVFSSWYCGVGPSLVAVLVGFLGCWYWFEPPYRSFALSDPRTQISEMLVFAAVCGFIIALGESNRRSKARAQREIAERRRAEDELRKAHGVLEQKVEERTRALKQSTTELAQKAKLLDLANDTVFVRDAEDKISYWNRGAERLYGWTSGEALGQSLHEFLRTGFPIPLSELLQLDRWEGELRHTTKDGSRITVVSRWTRLRDEGGSPAGWLEINTDITARKRAEQAARSLSGRLLSVQDEERRKIARGLHDSLGQYLSALRMNLDLLSAADGTKETIITECSEIVKECLTETRTISYLLHPPTLDEAGFPSAAQWYVEGFARRSGIRVNVDLPSQQCRFHADVETALFRVVQEALTNVHRHSGASQVDIRFASDAKEVHLEVRDNGRGIPKGELQRFMDGSGTGVGLSGMRERMRELNGSLEIQSDETGTLLRMAIPITESTDASAASTDHNAKIGLPAA